MAAIESLLSESAGAKKRRVRMVISILIGVLLLHVAAGVIAGIFIVAKYIFPPPANFVVKKDIRLAAKKREQKMNMASLDAIAPKPTLSDKMQSTRPTAFSLPDVPDMPLDQMLPLDPSQLMSDQMTSLSTSDALGTSSGAGSAGSGGFGGKGIGFLGVESNGDRILFIFDASQTVPIAAARAGIPFEKIQEEMRNLIKKMHISARFGISFHNEFVSGNFKPELAPNSNSNRKAADSWVSYMFSRGKGVSGAPPGGLEGAFTLSQKLKPDVVFIISDGDYKSDFGKCKKIAAEIKDENGKLSQINIILFAPKGYRLEAIKDVAKGNNINVVVK